MLWDSHCHLYKMDDGDLQWVLRRARWADVKMANCCNVTGDPYDVQRSIGLAENNDDIVSYFGLPYYFEGMKSHKAVYNEKVVDMAISTIRELANSGHNIAGIGEVGLDYRFAESSEKKKVQMERFEKFISLAEELNLPLVVHSVTEESTSDVISMLRDRILPVILYGYIGTLEQAKEAASLGWLVGIWPSVTYAKYLRELAKELPLESLSLPSDSPLPFFLPVPGVQRSEPANVVIAAKEIAEIKGISLDEVESVIGDRHSRIFGKA